MTALLLDAEIRQLTVLRQPPASLDCARLQQQHIGIMPSSSGTTFSINDNLPKASSAGLAWISPFSPSLILRRRNFHIEPGTDLKILDEIRA